jgi:hypothetical protein
MVVTHYSFNELTGAVESRVYNSEGTLVRYNGKHLADNNSQYQTNIVLQLSDNETNLLRQCGLALFALF